MVQKFGKGEMKVKFVDLISLHRPIMRELGEAINKVINKSNFILGDDVQIFEENWSRYTKQKYSVGVSSGYDVRYVCDKIKEFYKNK